MNVTFDLSNGSRSGEGELLDEVAAGQCRPHRRGGVSTGGHHIKHSRGNPRLPGELQIRTRPINHNYSVITYK